MNWEAIGAIGEALGAFGVIVSLVFLTLQIRQNTRQLEENARALRTTALDETQRSWDHFREHLIRDRSVAELWNRGLTDPKALDETDAARFEEMIEEYFYASNSAFQRAMSVGDPDHWNILHGRQAKQILSQPGALDYWSRCRGQFFRDFAAELDRLLAE
jgi:hypothetical protein